MVYKLPRIMESRISKAREGPRKLWVWVELIL